MKVILLIFIYLFIFIFFKIWKKLLQVWAYTIRSNQKKKKKKKKKERKFLKTFSFPPEAVEYAECTSAGE